MDRKAALDQIRSLLQRGAPWAASDAYRSAISAHADDPDLMYWGALAFARSGATAEARALIDRIRRDPAASDVIHRESLCLSGRLWKDRIDRTNAAERVGVDATRLARDEYLAAYAIDGAVYPAANAASLSMVLGEGATATTLAHEVLARLASRPKPLSAWDEATKGEALVLLGNAEGARSCYAAACEQTRDDLGSIASMRIQLAMLARTLPAARDVLDALPSAAVFAFAGHMIDAPDRAVPRFPPALESTVAARLRDRLASTHRPIVYTSAAYGSDLLFIEAALDVEAEVNIVLPFDRDDFVESSVAPGGADWIVRFDRALARATRVIQATEERYLGDDVLFEHAQNLVGGMAVLRASQLQAAPTLLCVLDDASPALVGGTFGAYARWPATGGRLDVIALEPLRRQAAEASTVAPSPPSSRPATPTSRRPPRTLKTMLFADMAGFSRLHDAHAPLFHQRFLGLVSTEIAACPSPPLEANTWGDALYAVFADAEEGAAFALRLVERMGTVDWTEAGLTETSHVRVALNAGPVFCGFDPIMGRDNYFGTSVTKAARIEPVTPPGVVYASEAFAATLASSAFASYVFEYVGELALAKSFGPSRIYRIDRR